MTTVKLKDRYTVILHDQGFSVIDQNGFGPVFFSFEFLRKFYYQHINIHGNEFYRLVVDFQQKADEPEIILVSEDAKEIEKLCCLLSTALYEYHMTRIKCKWDRNIK
jgi:hypothetical protein